MSLLLKVPREDEDEAKALGAICDPWTDAWYADVPRDEYVKFAKWILADTDRGIIATDQIFIVEGTQACWKCGQSTRVVGLGISGHMCISDGGDGPCCENFEDDFDEELHLAWIDREERVPPKLRKYLTETYSVKTGYSRAMGRECFANHCDHCGALQGNWYLFEEPGSSLMIEDDEDESMERASRLKIYEIPIGDDLQLDLEPIWGSADYVYLDCGQRKNLPLFGHPKRESGLFDKLRDLSYEEPEDLKKQDELEKLMYESWL